MKKNDALKSILFAVVGLVAGLLIGMSINGFPPRDTELAGSIGKVDNKRNVRITEEDVLLRNDLAEDTVKLLQYQRYLSYIYYKSLKSSADIERVIKLTSDNQEFIKSLNQTQTLEGYLTYLNTARADVLTALQAVENPDMDNQVPIIQYLNDAQNAASRIQSNEGIFLTYLEGIETWLAAYPDKDNKKLKEAHDLLAFNMMQNALIAQDKPLLSYLEGKKLFSDNQTLYTVFNDTIQKNEIIAFMEQDNTSIANFNAQSSDKIIKSVEQLNLVGDYIGSAMSVMVVLNNAEVVNSTEILGTGFNTDQQKLGAINDEQKLGYVRDQQKLGAINDQQKLQAIYNQPKLGIVLSDNLTLGAIISGLQSLTVFDQQKLGAINDQQKLGTLLDQQKLGLYGDAQSLGGVFILNQQTLGAVMNDLQVIHSEALKGGLAW